jgi:very-short-patch-repair endonuclease
MGNKSILFIEKAIRLHGNKYDYSLVDYINTKTNVEIICLKHGTFKQTPKCHLAGSGCQKCRLNKISNISPSNKHTKDSFIILSNNRHKNKYDYSLVNYRNNYTKVIIVCPKHGSFLQTPKIHLNGSGCLKCASYNRTGNNLNKQMFIERSLLVHGNKYDYSLVDYINTKTKVKIICSKHGIFEQIPQHHMNGFSCQKCANNFKSLNDFLYLSLLVHGNKYDYSLVDYINTKTKVKIICSKHGIFEQKPIHHYNGAGCPKCKTSKGEIFIINFLNDKKIKFETQKRFKDCRVKYPLPFDFYLIDKNLCIEYDGEQHFIPSRTWGGIDNLKITQERDKIKTNYCNDNNIKLIRIKYTDDKLTILNQIIMPT